MSTASERKTAAELARKLADLDRRLTERNTPQLAHQTIVDGAIEERDDEGNLVATVGKQFDGGHTMASLTGPKPPTPSPAHVLGAAGGYAVRWDGLFVDADGNIDETIVLPTDWTRAEVHASADPADPANTADTLENTIESPRGSTVVVAADPGTYYVRLVSRSAAGKASDPSAPVEVVVTASSVDGLSDRIDAADAAIDATAADLAQTKIDLDARLDTAETDLTAHAARLTANEGELTDAFGQLGTVDSRIAASASSTLTAAASDAQTKADAVQAIADAAQADADAAATAAATAAGIANGKGKVLVQSTAPGVDDRNAVTLWIDTTGGANTPKRWTSGTTWVAVTDKTATDAATAAATATTKANAAQSDATQALADAAAAQSAAGSAQTTANSALTMAGTKGKVYYSTAAPSGTGTATGDLWRHIDASKNVIGEWYWTGSAWQASQITTSAISNLDVGKLTVGTGVIATLVAQTIAGATASFQTVDVKNLFATTGTLSEAVIARLFTDIFATNKLSANQVLIGSGPNLVPNGYGELGDYGWPVEFTRDEADTPSGIEASFRSDPGEGTVHGDWAPITVTPSTPYRVELWVKADLPGSRLYVELRDQNSAHGTVSEAIEGFPNGNPGSAYPIANAEVPTTWTKWTCQSTTNADVESLYISGIYVNHPNGTETGAVVWFAGLSIQPMASTSLVATGTIIAPHIVASEEMSAKLGEFLHVHAGQLDADTIDFMTATGLRIVAGIFETDADPARGLKMDSSGLRAYGQTDNGNPAVEIRPDGATAISVTDPVTGDALATLGSDGTVSGTGLNIIGDPILAGNPLLGNLATYESPNDQVVDGILDIFPRGVIAYGTVNVQDKASAANSTGWMALMELGFTSLPGRAYRVTMTPLSVITNGSGNTMLSVNRTTDGSKPRITSDAIYQVWSGGMTEGSTNRHIDVFGGTFVIMAGYSGTQRLLFSLGTDDAATAIRVVDSSNAGAFRVLIEDIGPNVPDTGVERTDTLWNTVETQPTPPPTKKSYSKTYLATGWRTYDGDGTTSNYATSKMFQGQSPGTSNIKRSIAVFPSMTGDLSGATITSVQCYFYFNQWYYNSGGTADIMLHGQSSLPSSRPSMTNCRNITGWPKPGGMWVSIPSSYWAGFKSGTYRGVGLGDGTSGYTHYGYANGSSTRIKINYTK